MKYFIVEGILKAADKINDSIMKEHMAYTQRAMEAGMILTSGLKSDMSGGIFVMKAEALENIEAYLSKETFNVYGIQEYKITEFEPHYFNQSPSEWFNK